MLRFLINGSYSGLSSNPMAFRFRSLHTSNTVPDPQNGSSTVPAIHPAPHEQDVQPVVRCNDFHPFSGTSRMVPPIRGRLLRVESSSSSNFSISTIRSRASPHTGQISAGHAAFIIGSISAVGNVFPVIQILPFRIHTKFVFGTSGHHTMPS